MGVFGQDSHFIRQGRRLPRDVEDADVEKLFAVISSARDRAMFLLMVRCGLRVSEVRNSAQALDALRDWLAVRPVAEDQALFLNRFGRRFTVTGIQDRLAHYCRQTGVWITCHQLRHTFGRHMVEARMPVTSLQRLLGHARIRTTQVYMYISDQQVQADYEAAMEQVDQRLADPSGCLPEGGSQ